MDEFANPSEQEKNEDQESAKTSENAETQMIENTASPELSDDSILQNNAVQLLEEKLTTIEQNINQNIAHIHDGLLQKFKKDQTLREAFDKLYGEMEQYKNNFLRAATKPLVLDLVLLYDNMLRSLKRLENTEAHKIVHDLVEELDEVLYRRDVEKIEVTDNKLNRKLQRAVKTIPTDNEEEDGLVVEIVREGFLWEEIVLRPQEVIIKRYVITCTKEKMDE